MTLSRAIMIIISLMAFAVSYCAPVASDSLPEVAVSLITCAPGKEIYELEGHTALRVRVGEEDMAVNYGLFSFSAPNFVYRFVKGETDYMVGAAPYSYFLSQYIADGREVYEQPLKLTQEQAWRLVGLLNENLKPQNRTYRYNYVKDNCATRPLSILEQAIGDTIAVKAPGYTSGWSFRDAMRHYHRDYPWYQFGIDLALGSGIDYPISDREKAFVPMLLMEMIGKSGLSDTTIIAQSVPTAKVAATPWWLTPMAVAVAVLVLTIIVVIIDLLRHEVTRWFDAVIFFVYGIAGCVIAFLVFVSQHEATSPNMLILWLNPLCLIVPIFIYIKSCRKLVKCYGIVNFVALFLLAVLWPWSGQSGNIAFIPLVLADALLTIRYLYISRCKKLTNHA